MLNINTKILELVVVSPLSYLDYSLLVHPQNIEKQYHWNMLLHVLLKWDVSFPLLWVCKEVLTSSILEMKFWTHDKLDILMHEKEYFVEK